MIKLFSTVPYFTCNLLFFFFFNDTATTEIYTLSLHDALPISGYRCHGRFRDYANWGEGIEDWYKLIKELYVGEWQRTTVEQDRKSTRLNSSHANISYAVFCLKKKKIYNTDLITCTTYSG